MQQNVAHKGRGCCAGVNFGLDGIPPCLVHVVVPLVEPSPRQPPRLQEPHWQQPLSQVREPVDRAGHDAAGEVGDDVLQVRELLAGLGQPLAQRDPVDHRVRVPVVVAVPLLGLEQVLGQQLGALELLPRAVLFEVRTGQQRVHDAARLGPGCLVHEQRTPVAVADDAAGNGVGRPLVGDAAALVEDLGRDAGAVDQDEGLGAKVQGGHLAILGEGLELHYFDGGRPVCERDCLVLSGDVLGGWVGWKGTAGHVTPSLEVPTFLCSSSSFASFKSNMLPRIGKPEGPGGSLGSLPSLPLRLPMGLKYSATAVKKRITRRKNALV